jgi:NAD(P)-dependent dehydrogenase (short-subunit alcohol dehydrogenase family)
MTPTSFRSLFDLAGRVAVVTGGAGILGQRFVAGLADHGAAVAVVDLDGAGATKVAEDVAKSYGVRAIGIGADISDPKRVHALAEQVAAQLGEADILLNNAGTKGRNLDAFFQPVESYDLATWREIMAVNLDGMFSMAQAFGGPMAKRGRGSIVQTASIYGVVAPDQRIYEGSQYMNRPINTPAVYSASKAGVVGLTRYLAAYWGASGVRVNTLTPGGVASGQNDEFNKRYSARVPLGRMARADELVGAAIFLASDASSYVTGHNIVVDGGLSTW